MDNQNNQQKNRRKVKDIFAPHELKPSVFIETPETFQIPEEDEEKISLEMEEKLVTISRIETTSEGQEEKEEEEVKEEKEREPAETIIIKPPTRTRKKIKNLKPFLLFGIPIALVVLYYIGFVGLARADIEIITQKMQIPFSKSIVVDSNVSSIDTTKAVIPGNLFVFNSTETQEFKSTGQGKNETKAKGVITIYNNYSTSPQILVATTRFETPDHKIFRLDSRVVIPGATTENGKLVPSTIDVKVTADKPGPDYNIGPCQLPDCKFTIPGFQGMPEFNGFYGVSKQPMAGGSSGSVPMVSAEDIKNAEGAILEKIMNSINQDVENKVPEELIILPGAKSGVKISKIESDAEIGDYTDKFTVSAEVEIKIIAFNKSHILNFIQSVLSEEKDENYDFCSDPQIEYSDLETDFEKGSLKITIKTNQTLCHQIDLEMIENAIIGKTEEELDEIFRNTPGIEEVKIKFWPFWIKKVPNSQEKINLLVK
ncbi:MAG: hypothetical protein WC320_01575 [Candidatus Paceibacterota bacterium]|jgi:hypothetical protein